MNRLIVISIVAIYAIACLNAQEKIKELKKLVNVSVLGQIWAPYSMNAQAKLDEEGAIEPMDDRIDIFFRRARLNFESKPTDYLQFNLQLFYDNLGKENVTSVRGEDNYNAQLGIWDAFLIWNIIPEQFNLVAGYFRPQIGRESITSFLQVNSFEKSIVQTYLREHAIGRSNGRETGINIGGNINNDGFGINYNFGFFDSNHEKLTGTASGGKAYAPIYVGRIVFMIGDPENEKYSISYKMNYFGQRTGVSLAVNGSYTGKTDIFRENSFIGADILANWNGLTFDAEYDILNRTKSDGISYQDACWHIRSGYTFLLGDDYIEPSVLYSNFQGDENSLYKNGKDEVIDIGMNYYIFKNDLKVALHYITSNGEPVSKHANGKSFERGDVLALGLQFKF